MNQVSVCLTWNFIWAPRHQDQQMLQFYCLLLQFYSFPDMNCVTSFTLLSAGARAAGEHWVTLPLLFSSIIPTMKFSCKYLHKLRTLGDVSAVDRIDSVLCL